MENHNGFPGALPAIFSGLEGSQIDLVPGEGFWARIEQIAVKGEMTRGLDTAMHGRPSPRIWLFLHEPGRGELSAAVAMSFARELAFRDQAALVLDCDDQNQALTRWAGRLEAEGWIDLARYGTSVLTSGMPMPFVGRRGYLLGVGSFAPTDVTGKEVDTLLTRLRRQADDLLLVAPADSAGMLWAPAAAIRILCWDRQTVPAETAANQARKFEEAGCPLTAVVTFQEAGTATESLVDQVFAEVDAPQDSVASEPAAPPAADPPDLPADPPAVVAASGDEPDEDIRPEPGSGDRGEAAPGPETGEETRWEDLPLEQGYAADASGAGDDFELPPGGPPPARSTSRVFWAGAVIAVAVIVAATGYYFKYVRVPAEGHFEQLEIAAGNPGSEPGDRAADQTGDGDAVPSSAGADSLDTAAAVVPDSLAVAGDFTAAQAPGDTVVPGATDPSTPRAAESTPDGPPVEAPVEETVAETPAESPAETPVTEAPVFDMEPYLEPVGAKGWALHVYSFSDSPGTARQVEDLDRRGFQSEVKIFDLGEKGRWFRIYLGSFASRTEARAAMPALLKKLRVDWAKPEIFKTSAPE